MPKSCADCQTILRSVEQVFSDGLNNKPDADPFSPVATGRFTNGLQSWEKAATQGTCTLCKIMYFCPRSETHQFESLGGQVGTSTWGPRAANSLRHWLDGCIESHDECQGLPDSSLPMRLIEVMPPGTDYRAAVTVDNINALSIDAMSHVKLLSTADQPGDVKYLTLSHCWGESVPIKLLNKLKSIYAKQIPIEDLLQPEAKVFREAMWVTRCLGYRYLWIDALCINQEDENEKAIEVARMDQIYSGATVNLSATSASCGAEGMIFTRQESLYELFPCNCKTVEMGQEKHDYLVAYVDENKLDEEPANTRAWVFQERILAPRVIHFCRNKIFRECSQEQMDELQDYSPWISIPKQASQAHINLISDEGLDGLGKEQDFYHQFRSRLEIYSRTALSFPQDRLSSVAGISKAIGRYMGLGEDEYFAGVWRNDLPKALLWKTRYSLGNKNWDPENAGYISPSWSWAGCEAPDIRQKLDTPPFEDLIEVINIWTVPEKPGGSHFGKIRDGRLTLRGRLFEIHRKRIGDGFLISVQDGNAGLKDELYFESKSLQTTRESEKRTEGTLKEVDIYWDRYTKDLERVILPLWQVDASLDSVPWDDVDPEILYFLPISQFTYQERAGTRILMVGLVLQHDDSTGRYRRIGLFEIEEPKWDGSNHELRMRLLKGSMVELTII
ncbi:hypothetical protein FGSG_04011 [Fusarium graminearum PH-1]|uniref:Chromosome 2, complete genome n=1 Tax=Gibberella zeae (strain ATCC MYA-4620 / CBS 123657 / FGSC 9075 / NRRL 31084 / PH-1) TaxID=229533 RepID=I1RJI9_GIBZE|nr:hypothetical protein FGSG_04011 [Fusarium graminearum PH-1]ESU09145.1 hypothetical protein FGSG_04011 [Fusarium graminearum PH-1]CEF78928.1 unnamed protein product [Fusarium graminearum]|eukprot:XP_011321644.1 hypothetical protein FGSG_04011 [Fusarium graminearum PH-1]